MKIASTDKSYETGVFLSTLADIINAQAPETQVERETEPGAEKGEIVTAIILGVGSGLLASSFYDLIKMAVARVGKLISEHQNVTIAGRTVSLLELNVHIVKELIIETEEK